MSVDSSEALVTLSKAVLKMQDDVKALHSLFLDNVTFIKGMGDVPDQMGRVLMDIVDNHELSTKFALQQLVSSSEFFKNTTSTKYSGFNIIQEWFSELGNKVIDIFTDLGYEYIYNWSQVKVQDYIRERSGKLTGEMTYEERCVFGEWLFALTVTELGADPACHFILRALYIPYISIYYLRPFDEYPFLEGWLEDMQEYVRTKKGEYIQKV